MESDEGAEKEVESEEQFWDGLGEIVLTPCQTHEHTDDVLRSFLALTTAHKHAYLQSEYDIARCCYRLLNSPIFSNNPAYVRRQLLYCLLQDDDPDVLHLAAAFLLFDGRAHEVAFEMMRVEGAFPRLVELVRGKRDDDVGLHRLLLEVLFEMSRMQKLAKGDLAIVDDDFVLYLFELIEQLSDDADDPYHYPIIRVLLVLNEQYMCLANAPRSPNSDGPVTNRILKLLSARGPSYRTFGENLILLLNRESALSAQLLILKLLYLLFTNPPTYEYFYTNDLHVLVDVIIRNLLDLDPGASDPNEEDGEKDGQRALRHTYLRVLCPLLKNTQLAREGRNYKRDELRKLLHLLVHRSSAHFAPVDQTVIRLVLRCKQVDWLADPADEADAALERQLAAVAPSETAVAQKMLGMSLADAGVSSLSVVDVSANVAREKPSVPAPRRNRKKKGGAGGESGSGHASAGDASPGTEAETSSANGAEAKVALKAPPGDVPRIVEPGRDRSPFADFNAAP